MRKRALSSSRATLLRPHRLPSLLCSGLLPWAIASLALLCALAVLAEERAIAEEIDTSPKDLGSTVSANPELEIELIGEAIRGRLGTGLDLARRVLVLERRELALRDVLRIRFRRNPIPPRWTVSIRLADGTRVHGTILPTGDHDLVRVKVPSLDAPLEIPLEWIREIRSGAEVSEAAEDVVEDQVETNRSAAIEGVIERISPDGVEIEQANLGKLEIPWDQIERVRVAPLDPLPPPPEGSVLCLISADDGSRWRGSLLALDAETLRVESPILGPLTISEEHRVAIELLLDRVIYLSDRVPRKVEEGIPFSGYFPWTYKRDRNVLGGPLRIGRETYRKGIGVHSRSALTFAIEPGDLVFRAEVGIDVVGRPVEDNPQAGSVRFVTLLDGEEAWRSGDVGWADLPVSVELPLRGHSELTLLVEMGLGLHVLDRANWGDARVLRE